MHDILRSRRRTHPHAGRRPSHSLRPIRTVAMTPSSASTVAADPWTVTTGDFPRTGSPDVQSRFLLRYAILAPSSHNTQPWQFAVDGHRIDVMADLSRSLPIADPDRRELFVSIGCALENLLVAAAFFGFEARVTYADISNSDDDEPDASVLHAATVHLDSAGPHDPDRATLFDAITHRHTNHQPFQEREISEGDRQALEDQGTADGIRLWTTADPDIRVEVDRLVARANAMQFLDAAWREELATWFGQGVFGTPWLTSKIGQLAITYLDLSDATTATDRKKLETAPLLGVLAAEDDTPETNVRVGQMLEQVWLDAALRGIQLQPMNQILQIPEIKAEVRTLLPESEMHPQLTFRLGYAESERRHTPRRPLEEVVQHRVDA